jgi:hypothetical protein
MGNLDAYRALRAESKRIGLPTSYQADLTKHDRLRLSRRDAPLRFVWVLRSSGTWLLTAYDDWAESVIKQAVPVEGGHKDKQTGEEWHCYIYDSRGLRECKPQQAVDFLKALSVPWQAIDDHGVTLVEAAVSMDEGLVEASEILAAKMIHAAQYRFSNWKRAGYRIRRGLSPEERKVGQTEIVIYRCCEAALKKLAII